MLSELKLVKAGYGSLKEVQLMDTRTFLQTLYYEQFLADYELARYQLNKRDA